MEEVPGATLCVVWALSHSGQILFFSVCFGSFIQFVHFSTDKIKNKELATIYNIKLQN
jgi:hypothetical protein